MDGFYKAGNCEKASSLRDWRLEAGLQPDIISYNIIFKGLCSFNRTPEAAALLNDALGRRSIPTSIAWSILVQAIFSNGPMPT